MKQEIIATLLRAKRPDLVKAYAEKEIIATLLRAKRPDLVKAYIEVVAVPPLRQAVQHVFKQRILPRLEKIQKTHKVRKMHKEDADLRSIVHQAIKGTGEFHKNLDDFKPHTTTLADFYKEIWVVYKLWAKKNL